MSKRNAQNVRSNGKYDTIKFVNHYFNDAEVNEFVTWADGRTLEMFDVLVVCIEAGWKVTLSYDEVNDVYFVALTGKKTHTRYDGTCIMIRHKVVDRLPALVSFLYTELLLNNRVMLTENDRDLTF